MAFKCAKLFKGDYLIYVGDPQYEITADTNFYRILSNNFKMIREIEFFGFDTLFDSSLQIFEKK